MERTLNNLLTNDTLKFIFVGGKGGVGKTTTSSSIALAMSQTRGKTLIISTDPAHNLSDAFNRKFTHEPTLVEGTTQLYAMEIDPKKNLSTTSSIFEGQQLFQGVDLGFTGDILAQVPGIDEAIVFMDLLKLAKAMDFDVVIFDTAPTGHTLKLLTFPNTMRNGLEKLLGIKSMVAGVMTMFGNQDIIDSMFGKIDSLKADTEHLKEILANPALTTFVAVCIPEYLSVFETERLVQELAVQNINIFNIVVNQIVFFDETEQCKKCRARFAMQYKYIKQIFELYADFNIALMPLENGEVRDLPKLQIYADKLKVEQKLPIHQNN